MSISKIVLVTVALVGLSCALLAVPPVPVPANVAGVPGVTGLVALIQSLVVLLLTGLVNTIPTDLNAIIAALPIVGGVQLPPINVPNLPNVSVLVSLLQALIAVVLSLLSILLQAPLPALSGIIPTGLVGTIPATLDAVLKSLPLVGGLLGGGGLSSLPILVARNGPEGDLREGDQGKAILTQDAHVEDIKNGEYLTMIAEDLNQRMIPTTTVNLLQLENNEYPSEQHIQLATDFLDQHRNWVNVLFEGLKDPRRYQKLQLIKERPLSPSHF
uniref:Uncharacterized protein n=1 Tax=Ditylenchus dipsaci TaxID=166011 RepID=A0A915DIG2_9BILA